MVAFLTEPLMNGSKWLPEPLRFRPLVKILRPDRAILGRSEGTRKHKATDCPLVTKPPMPDVSRLTEPIHVTEVLKRGIETPATLL